MRTDYNQAYFILMNCYHYIGGKWDGNNPCPSASFGILWYFDSWEMKGYEQMKSSITSERYWDMRSIDKWDLRNRRTLNKIPNLFKIDTNLPSSRYELSTSVLVIRYSCKFSFHDDISIAINCKYLNPCDTELTLRSKSIKDTVCHNLVRTVWFFKL